MWSADVSAVEEKGKTGGFSVGDFFLANKHEPLDTSHGARIMAKEVGVSFLIFLKNDKDIIAFTKESSYYLRSAKYGIKCFKGAQFMRNGFDTDVYLPKSFVFLRHAGLRPSENGENFCVNALTREEKGKSL